MVKDARKMIVTDNSRYSSPKNGTKGLIPNYHMNALLQQNRYPNNLIDKIITARLHKPTHYYVD